MPLRDTAGCFSGVAAIRRGRDPGFEERKALRAELGRRTDAKPTAVAPTISRCWNGARMLVSDLPKAKAIMRNVSADRPRVALRTKIMFSA